MSDQRFFISIFLICRFFKKVGKQYLPLSSKGLQAVFGGRIFNFVVEAYQEFNKVSKTVKNGFFIPEFKILLF